MDSFFSHFIHPLCLSSGWMWVGAVAKLPLILCRHCCLCMNNSHSSRNVVLLNDAAFQKQIYRLRLTDVSSSPPLSTLRSQATWTSPWWTCPSCSARSPSWRAWCSTVTACTTVWLRRSPWDSSSGTCKCEHTHTHRGVTHSDGRRSRLPFVKAKPTVL